MLRPKPKIEERKSDLKLPSLKVTVRLFEEIP
jgi:hypothetical protein